MLRVRLRSLLHSSRLVPNIHATRPNFALRTAPIGLRHRTTSLPIYTRSSPSSLPPGAVLPPQSEWKKYIPTTGTQSRVSLSNSDTADRLVNDIIPDGVVGLTVVEAFPGPGTITRALMRLPRERIAKIYVMEEHEAFLPYLNPLAEMDDRVTIIPRTPYSWDSYSFLSDLPSPTSLHYISHIPLTTMGEQLIAQYFRLIPDSQWFFSKKFRSSMTFLLTEYLHERIAPSTKGTICKLTVMADATVKHSEWNRQMGPYEEEFYPISIRPPRTGRHVGAPMTVLRIEPLDQPLIEPGSLDKWDYCTRRLFVQKASPLWKALPSLGPGASAALLPKLEHMKEVSVRDLSVLQWKEVVKAFSEWPFAPENLDIADMDGSRQDKRI